MSTNVKSIPRYAMSLINRKHMTLNRNKVKSKSEACPYMGIWTFTKV